MQFFKNPAKDAKNIQDTIDYRVLKAAWDCQAQINAGTIASVHKATTPAWFALFAIQNYNGDFGKFTEEELHLLKSLTNVQQIYDRIINALEDNIHNEELGRYIINTNPALQNIVPAQYDNVLRINEYIIIVIKDYKKLLSEYYEKYKNKIDYVIEKLERQKAHSKYSEANSPEEEAECI